MSTPATIVTVFAALWIGFSAFSVFTHKSWVVDNFVDYGVPRAAWPWLGLAKLLGAVGLLVGIWVPAIGVAAAVALVLYFVGAVVTVLRAKAWAHVPFPLLYLVPAAAAGLLIAQA
ncbi:MAG TPA: DoxX family protein [Intrasporangium sp.]|nr:DoxX family protein [Intrasporangium sp.]